MRRYASKTFYLAIAAALIMISGCAGHLPVPGGESEVNSTYYESEEDFLKRLDYIYAGMHRDKVFNVLERKEGDLDKMNRNDIVRSLYGTDYVQFQEGTPEHKAGSMFLQTLKGYRLHYKVTAREHGFSSPIRVNTEEQGYEYYLVLIFKDDRLYHEPILTGGVVHRKSSSTLFDGLNPGDLFDRALN